MAIFEKPKTDYDDADVKIIFLHGLEGSTTGEKSIHLHATWHANSPAIRTQKLQNLRAKMYPKGFQQARKRDLEKAIHPAYEDARDAVRYARPDLIVGSSLGGALLARLVMEGEYDGHCVFLAPAIENLLGTVVLPPLKSSVWILAETDDQVSNASNIRHCMQVGGNLMMSPNDNHRLQLALKNGLIDSAIVTSLEIGCNT